MKDVMEVVGDWVGAGDPVALATVVDTKKSAPQPPGTKMAINEAGRMAGAVSGGCVEGQVVQVAEGILRGGPPQLLEYGIADEDAWDVGLPCGGRSRSGWRPMTTAVWRVVSGSWVSRVGVEP